MPSELTVIIPTLNEVDNLQGLLSDLSRQKDVALEVTIVDGGSSDGTIDQARLLLDDFSLLGQVVKSDRGRGRQLNLGASIAQSEWLLFLHADSRLVDDRQFRLGIDRLKQSEHSLVAGRFRLCFDLNGVTTDFSYFFYEAKARLDRAGCIHGDQGFLLTKRTFLALPAFREDLPVLEDTGFAEQIRRHGRWVLLDSELRTSARRFCSEGLRPRQTLNALLMNFLAIGWDDFLISAPGIYRLQSETEALSLKPFFIEIRQQLQRLGIGQRFRIWLATGRYVRSNAWQLVFVRLAAKSYQKSEKNRDFPLDSLDRFDLWFDRLTDHCIGHVATAVLVWSWYRYHLHFSRD